MSFESFFTPSICLSMIKPIERKTHDFSCIFDFRLSYYDYGGVENLEEIFTFSSTYC